MSDTQITIKDSGPYLVKGPMTLTDAEGSDFTIDKEVIALCRCGASTTQPFCNGTHRKIGFESVVRSPASESDQ
ncbi:MAG: CDGSH iron-sulfur domain-containing protein [Phormidesmis sp.]